MSKVVCSCGWSWNKSDSSKKDMYVCHKCGNANAKDSMENGGWLDSISQAQDGINSPNVRAQEQYFEERNKEAEEYEKFLGNTGEELIDFGQRFVQRLKFLPGIGSTLAVVEAEANNQDAALSDELGMLPFWPAQAASLMALYAEKENENFQKFAENRDRGKDLSQLAPEEDINNRVIDNTYVPKPKIVELKETKSKKIPYKEKKETNKVEIDNTRTVKPQVNTNYKPESKPEIKYKFNIPSITYSDNSFVMPREVNDTEIDNTYVAKPRLKNGGWLDAYNEEVPQAQNGIEGTMAGLTDKGFNYNGAWGGQFQEGGDIPQAQNGKFKIDFNKGPAGKMKNFLEEAKKKKENPIKKEQNITVKESTKVNKNIPTKIEQKKQFEPLDDAEEAKLNIPEQVYDQINHVRDWGKNKENYAVIDKKNNVMYYVNPAGRIIGYENVITGATNKDEENAPSMLEYGKTANEYYDYLKNTDQRVTPAGVFTLRSNKNNSVGKPHSLWDRVIGELPFVDDVRLNTLDDPSLLHAIYNEMPWREEEKKEYYDHRIESYGPTGNMLRMISQYGVPSSKGLHGTGNVNRIKALDTPGADRNLSNGCINVGGRTKCFDILEDKANLYVMPEVPQKRSFKNEDGSTDEYMGRATIKDQLYNQFGHYTDSDKKNFVYDDDLKISREEIKAAKETKNKVADIINKNKIKATPEEIDFVAAVAQKETKGGKSWLSKAESVLPGFSSYGLYEQKESFPYLKGKSPNDEVASTQAVLDFYRDMHKKHPNLANDYYPNEQIYSTYNSGKEDWHESGIYYGPEFRKALQAVKGYENGGSLPGAPGHMYARVGAPSKGPRRNQVDVTDASAQNGQEMRYYQEGLDWKPKTISRDGAWLDGYDEAQDGKKKFKLKDERGEVFKTSESTNVKKKDFDLEQSKANKAYNNAVVAQKKEAARRKKLTQDQREREDYNAYNQERGEIKEYVPETNWERTKAIVSNPMTAIGYKTRGENLPGRFQFGPRNEHDYAVDWINPLQGAVALSEIPGELGRGEFLEAGLSGLDALDLGVYARGAKKALEPVVNKGIKALGAEEGLLSNAYKLNPKALKEAQEQMLVRARPVGQDPYINMAEQLKAKQAAGEQLTWYQKNLLNPQTNPQMAAREKYFGQWFADNPSDLDFYINPGTRNFADDAQIEILKARMPKSEAAKYNVKNFEDAKSLSNLHDTEYILPKDMVQQAERYSVDDLSKLMEEYNQINTPHWLKGYKKVPKQNNTQSSFIKQDLSEGNNIKYSFTNDQGNNIGTFSGKKSPEGIYVNSIEINPEFRRQGVASDIYKNIAKELQSKNEGTLFSRSGQHQFTGTDELGRSIAPANKLWENLVNKGEAEKFVEGMSHTYKIKPLKQGGIIKDDRGQWDHPGEITEIGSNDITMEGVPYPVLGISDTGDTKLMQPGGKYKYKGKKVTEFPMAKNGLRQEQKGLRNLDDLTNFTNYNKSTGWLSKYE